MAPKYPAHGVLNDIRIPAIGDKIDLQSTSTSVYRRMASQAFTPDALKNTGPYKAIVLRVERDTAPPAGTWLSDLASAFFGGQTTAPPLVKVRARIPEIHSMIPIPETIGAESIDPHIIDMYPIFIAQNEKAISLNDVKPGCLVWVDFVNKSDFTDAILLGPVIGQQTCPTDAGSKTAASTHQGACVGSLKASIPDGDGLAGINKNLRHTGLPKLPRRPTVSVVGKNKFITANRASPIAVNEWRSAIQKNGVPGISWIGSFKSQGATDKYHGEGKRDTIIYAPNTTDFTQPVELIYWWHGLGEFTLQDFSRRLAPSAKKLAAAGRNFVLVVCELPWSKRITKPATSKRPYAKLLHQGRVWSGNDNYARLHGNVLAELKRSFAQQANVSHITIVGHSAGGAALKNAAVKGFFNSVKPNKITFSDGDYGRQAQQVWNAYVKNNPNVEFNILTQRRANATTNKHARKFVASLTTDERSRVNWVTFSKAHRQIGDLALLYNGPTKLPKISAPKMPLSSSGSAPVRIKVQQATQPKTTPVVNESCIRSAGSFNTNNIPAAAARGLIHPRNADAETKSRRANAIQRFRTPGFKQYAKPWRDLQYGARCSGATFKSSACGATALADVLAGFGEHVDPFTIAQEIDKAGFRICGRGTSGKAITKIPQAHGKKSKLVSWSAARAGLQNGALVIAHASNRYSRSRGKGKNPFTHGGHYIVLRSYENGKVVVNDVGSSRPQRNGPIEERIIIDHCNLFWVVENA